jgi:futalosine hydrolase
MSRILVCHATPIEGEGLPDEVAGRTLVRLQTGVGPVNATFAVTKFLLENRIDALLVCGVGGAYPGSGLEPVDVVSAESETYGDLGAEWAGGFLDLKALGYPASEGDSLLSDRMPLDLFPATRRAVFVTCATCTGTRERADRIVSRTAGAVESMEGAAIVDVARRLGVRVGEVRGISNLVGDRDRSAWRVAEAAAAARASLLAWIEAGGC